MQVVEAFTATKASNNASNGQLSLKRRAEISGPFGCFRRLQVEIPRYYSTGSSADACRCGSRWAISDHFQICMKFEHSLPKMVTRQKTWSTTTAQASRKVRSGGPSLGRNPDAQKQ